MQNEQTLVALLRVESSKNQAFSQLVSLYQERIYWLIRRMVTSHEDANDLLQLTFIKVYENIHTFEEKSSLFTWLYKIAVNETLTFLKQQNRRKFLSFNGLKHVFENHANKDIHFNADEAQEILRLAILSLPEKQRIVFNMRYYEEIKYEEMSQILGTSVGALKASYHISEKKIEEFIKIHASS